MGKPHYVIYMYNSNIARLIVSLLSVTSRKVFMEVFVTGITSNYSGVIIPVSHRLFSAQYLRWLINPGSIRPSSQSELEIVMKFHLL